MTREEAIKKLQKQKAEYLDEWVDYSGVAEAFNMAIEALKAKCPTCKRCSDNQESGTRCPIEEHYALPKDGYCHLYEPYKAESEEGEA